MDVHSICRICLECIKDGNSHDLFLVPGLAEKLCMCTSLSVEPQDGFPNNICGLCYTRLSDMAEFQKLCVDSVQKFQELVANHKIVCPPTFDIMEVEIEFISEESSDNDRDSDEDFNFPMGEGSKPLFSRDDITVNQSELDRRDASSTYDHSFGCKSKTTRRSFSTESSSPERYRQRENKKHSSPTLNRGKSPAKSAYIEKLNHKRENPDSGSKFCSTKTDRHRRRGNTTSRSPSPAKQKPVEKIPYYRDERREKDRLKRLYGYSRSRSPSPNSGSPIRKRRLDGTSRRHSESRERHRRHSPYRSSRREYRSHRSKTRSRTRSPQRRERPEHLPKELDKAQKEDPNSIANAVISATPQYIPIPVPVPADYAAYSFPSWTPPQPHWHNSHHRPPTASHFAPFPVWPMIPPMRPSHQAPYVGMPPSLPYAPMAAQFRPLTSQRHPLPRHNSINYQSRPKKT